MPKSITETESNRGPSNRHRIWRRRLLQILALMMVVVIGPWLYSRVAASGNAVRIRTADFIVLRLPARNELHVVTWNIAHGRGTASGNWVEGAVEKNRRINEIAKMLRELDADVVVLNEVDFSASWSGGMNQAEAIANSAGYSYFAEQSNLDFRVLWYHWNFGNAILSRYPIESATVVNFPPKSGWESWAAGHKRGVNCEIAIPDFGLVSVVGVHLESRSEQARIDSIPVLRSLVNHCENPLILAGDLNTTPAGFPQASTDSTGRSAFDYLVEGKSLSWQPRSQSDVSQLTFSTMKPANIIDWILVSKKHWQFVNYRVVPSQLSDHFPVEAVVKFLQ